MENSELHRLANLKSFRTPIQKLFSLDDSNSIYIKREDLLPFSFGGNKVRIAYHYICDMLRKNCNVMIAYGSKSSNLCRVIANMCKCIGIRCIVVTGKEDEFESQSMNGRIINFLETELYECKKSKVSETLEYLINSIKAKGDRPYYIYGNSKGQGNEGIPIQAYVEVYEEIRCFEEINNLSFDCIFLASGTGTTQAGLIVANLSSANQKKIIGISIARTSEHGAGKIRESIKAYNPLIQDNEIEEHLELDDSYICGGYGRYISEIEMAVKDMLIFNGIPLDLTYTGKAFWGMTNYIKYHGLENKTILFIHTGGTPLFFDYIANLENQKD